jgi:hypothetical protein
MAKRHKKPQQWCPFCGAVTTAVLEEPTSRKLAGFWYEDRVWAWLRGRLGRWR